MFSVSQNKDASLVVLTRCRKLYVAGIRIHHGLFGEVLTVAGVVLQRPVVALAGLALITHDRHDFPFPLRDPEGWGPKQLDAGEHR